MKIWHIVALSALGLVVMVALSFGLGWTDVFYAKTVGKAREDARREVFEQTQSYVEAKRQELTKYRLEYMRADSSDRQAIKMTIVQSFANFDKSKLDYDLRVFLDEMMN